MAKVQLAVGEACPDCGTPAIMGKSGGGYCKPCYIKWKNAQKGQQVSTSVKQDPETIKGQCRMHLVCSMIEAGHKYDDIQKALPAYLSLVMNGTPVEKSPTPESVEKEVDMSDIPF